jgi:hypothetical protein
VRSLYPGPMFQTVDYTLELIYSQAIIWFGILFCPFVGMLSVCKCFVLFYAKKWATLHFCFPPKRAFQASDSMRGLIFGLLLFTMFIVSAPLTYIIVKLPTSGAHMDPSYQVFFI